MNTALVITIGNTADPILKAIQEIGTTEPGAAVYLVYGRPFSGQAKPTPFDVAHEARRIADERGLPVRLFEVPDPEDINVALAVTRDVLAELAGAKQVVVNFTGGTKVLSAAVVHAALTAPLPSELILDYTGGIMRDDKGRVIREAMRVKRSERTATEEALQQTLQSLRRAAYREASLLSRFLPDLGRAGFVKKVAEALALWDEFDYDAAVRGLQRLNEPAKALLDDGSIAPLPALVRRLLQVGGRLCAVGRPLQQLQQGAGKQPVESAQLPLLVADALENGARRLQEGRATDAVLRAYRAVEVATQVQLLKHGINPWRPDWSLVPNDTQAHYLKLIQGTQLPRELALNAGLCLLEALGQSLGVESRKRLKDLQQCRNLSYLEHGYQRVDRSAGERLHGYAAELCTQLLGESVDPLRASVRHST